MDLESPRIPWDGMEDVTPTINCSTCSFLFDPCEPHLFPSPFWVIWYVFYVGYPTKAKLRRGFVYSRLNGWPITIGNWWIAKNSCPSTSFEFDPSNFRSKWWWNDKKWVDFLKIKFHSKENIEWHCMQFKLNLNSILIELRCNWNDFKFNNFKKMEFKLVYKILKICSSLLSLCDYGVKKYLLKGQRFEKVYPFA